MLASAAIQAATLLGVEKEVGSLEPGKAADLIAEAGDPIADITTLQFVRFVIKDGDVASCTCVCVCVSACLFTQIVVVMVGSPAVGITGGSYTFNERL